jgi:hypothetical protein
MAGSGGEAVDPTAAGALAPARELSIRHPDLTQKGKSQGEASSSSAPSDRVAEMFGRLNLTTQESTAFVLEEGDEDYPGCPEWALVGKVLTPNPLHISTIKSVLSAAWGNTKGLEVNSGGFNLFGSEICSQGRQ